MDKKYIDDFYKTLSQNIKYQLFSISLPLFIINKELIVKSEQFLKFNYDLLQIDVDVMATLYFKGKDYSLLPTELYSVLIFSSGGMTKILKKLENKKLIYRTSVELDKRKNLVCLSKTGIETIEKIMNEKVNIINDVLFALTKKDKENLKNILSKILYSMKLN